MKQGFYKKKYTFKQCYIILYKALFTIRYMSKAKKAKLIDKKLIERIMLSVTEVNGCPICAYGHTKMALESGMSEEEILQLLSGETRDIPAEQAPAIMFAQHYADTEGNPTKASWQRILDTYGDAKAKGILGATRMIMMGNVYGMALSALGSRLRGKPVRNIGLQSKSKYSFYYEVGILLSIILFMPVAVIHTLVSKFLKKPIINF